MHSLSFKFGRRSPTNAPAIKFKNIRSGAATIPPHPITQDNLAQLGGWQMLGNDKYGDCVAVTWANERKVVSTILGSAPEYPNLSQVYTFYKTQNPNFPNDDNGMNIQEALNYLVKNGGPGSVKAVAFAKVDYTNLEEVKAALSIFGMLWIGINVQAANMNQFDAGQPWDYVKYSPDDGGHSIVGGGYSADAKSDVTFVTWGEETSFTDNFWTHQVEEAWVVIWPEHLGTKAFQVGIDINALANDYKALTGNDLPIVAPQPGPVPEPPRPTPTPVPTDADQLLWENIRAWVLSRHYGKNKAPAAALLEWAKAKGFLGS